MSLTLTALPLGQVTGNPMWHPTKCGLCLCFTDSGLIAVTGGLAQLTLVMSVLPSDGDQFTINGQTFTYRSSPTLDWEIQIGGTIATTQTNTATALLGHPDFNPSDYTILPFASFLLVTARKFGTAWNLTFTPDTATETLVSNVSGIDQALVADDYRVIVELLIQNTNNPLQWEVERALAVAPLITSDVDDEAWSYLLCLPIEDILQARITRTLPDVSDPTPASVLQQRYEWLLKFKARFAKFANGVQGPFTTSSNYYATDAICTGDGTDYGIWSADYAAGEIQMMLTKKSGLSYCKDTLVFLYCEVKDSLTYTVNVEWFTGGIWVGASGTIIPTRHTILEIAPHALYPSGYSGPVKVWVAKSGTDYELIQFTLRGDCCGQTFYFANRFGKYEIFQCGDIANLGYEIEVSQYTTCDSCGDSSQELEYATRFTKKSVTYSQRLNLDSQEDVDFVRDFFTSTDVWLLVDGTLERVRIAKGNLAVREAAAQKFVRFKVEYFQKPAFGN